MKNTINHSPYSIQRAGFSELSLSQFYALAKLRQDVFIIEQQSIYSDLDGLDSDAIHFLCWPTKALAPQLLAYARYRFCVAGKEVKIERVVCRDVARGQGLGKQLMLQILQDIKTQHTGIKISLSAQIEAQAFYQALGFIAHGERYDDGGIEHITMYYGS
jgi:ElaA protein